MSRKVKKIKPIIEETLSSMKQTPIKAAAGRVEAFQLAATPGKSQNATQQAIMQGINQDVQQALNEFGILQH